MAYELKEVLNILRVYLKIETEANKFLTISAFPMKNKAPKVKSAQTTLKAIEEYKNLPIEVRRELENDKSTHVSNIAELERLCRAAIAV